MWFLENAWLIPVIPAVAFALIILFGKRTARFTNGGAAIGLVSIATSFVLAVGTAIQWIQRVQDTGHGSEGALGLVGTFGRSVLPHAEEEAHPFVAPVIHSWTWWQSGGVRFSIGSHIDGLAVALLIVVTIISGLVHVFSLEYVRGDRRFTHYYAALSLFTAGMLNLVIAENTLQLLLGWEIMGLCSFMLIGHWWEEQKNSDAALKAFFTTRTGDVGLLVGIVVIFFGAGTFSIQGINEWAMSGQWSHTLVFWGALALFIGIIGKSGQFPLHTWLPDAMAGPTPVSALIHAATMVVAGVYLGARLYPVFYQGFNIADGPVNPMALIGGITIIIAAALAFVQVDIKKVLAYSTVSQLGYMIMGLGVGAWTPAVFHIFTHAFFKALLFLGAGSVSHSGAHHSFDMKKDMGGLRKHMPITFWTFVIGTLALSGIFPFAGFFSKDEILANAGENGYTAFMIVGLVGAFMTAAYMARCVYLTFFGEYRGGHDIHDETPALAHATIGSPPDAEASETDVEAEDYPLEDGVTRSLANAEHEARHELRAAGRDPEAAYDLAEGAVPAAASTRAAATAVLEHEAGVHAHDAHGGHDALGHDAHGAHGIGHGDGHDAHAGPHESGPLLTVPLIILAVLATISGFLLAPAFHTEKFLEWVEPSHLGESFPELAHAPFHWVAANGAVVSLAIALAGLVISFWLCVRVYERGLLADFTRRNAVARAGYTFLWNKYYLDHLYERVIIAGIKGPVARAAYWINQNVLDGIVNGAGIGAREGGRWVYRNVDQRVVDGIVNGTGLASESTGEGLRPIQSGKVSQYGALLFAAAGIGALILVLVV